MPAPPRKRAFVVALTVLVLTAGSFTALLYQTVIWFNMPSKARFPVRGIDVSHHQGAIDWNAVAGAGIRFAWIKATEGRDLRDDRFAENWAGATAAGILPGAYHFYSFCADPEEQAENLLAVMPRVRGLPPVVDVELVGNCSGRPDDLSVELTRFSVRVFQWTGRRPIVYTTAEVRDRWRIGGPFWMRDVFFEPEKPWILWQYGYARHLPGVEGLVDLDVFAGTEADLEALLPPDPEPEPKPPPAEKPVDPALPARLAALDASPWSAEPVWGDRWLAGTAPPLGDRLGRMGLPELWKAARRISDRATVLDMIHRGADEADVFIAVLGGELMGVDCFSCGGVEVRLVEADEGRFRFDAVGGDPEAGILCEIVGRKPRSAEGIVELVPSGATICGRALRLVPGISPYTRWRKAEREQAGSPPPGFAGCEVVSPTCGLSGLVTLCTDARGRDWYDPRHPELPAAHVSQCLSTPLLTTGPSDGPD